MEASAKPFSHFKLMLLAGFSVVLSQATYLLGGIPLRLLFIRAGSQKYWMLSLLLSFVLITFGGNITSVGMIFLSLVMLIGSYSEFEKRLRLDRFIASLLALLVGSGTVLGLLWYWKQGMGPEQSVTGAIKTELLSVVQLMIRPGQNKDELFNLVYKMLPSLVVLSMGATLALSFIYERVWWREKKFLKRQYFQNLLEFKVPDHFVWLVCGLAMGAFTEIADGVPYLKGFCLNGFVIFAGFYFFQGVAITVQILRSFKISGFLQALILILMIGQAYFLSFIGFIDLWLDFRGRLKNNQKEKAKSR